MKKAKTARGKILFILLALLICLQPLCAYAEGEDGEEAWGIPEYVEEEVPEPEEEIVEEQAEPSLPEELEAEPVAEEVVIEEEYGLSSVEDYGVTEAEKSESEGDNEAEEETAEETVELETETVCDPDAGDDNDALFQAFFEDLLMPHPRLRRPVGASNLSGVDLNIYNILTDEIGNVAQKGGSTIFEVDILEIGTQVTWTKEELGGITIISGGKITEEAKAAVSARLNTGNISLVSSALMQDNPYWMYWYDKTTGVKVNTGYKLTATKSSISISSGSTTYSFSVSVDYGSNYNVDSAEVLRAQTAAENAKAIVRTYAAFPDHEKLEAYKDEICALTSYNYAAAHGGYPYGDPWQAIYVFDGDESTAVVCEGYSKAFEYLCDMSEFISPAVSCISVTGTMDGENHMWNIVTLADGKNYLADVTNSDGSSVGGQGQLFLAGYTSGSALDGYGVACGRQTIRYVYSGNMLNLMTEEELTIVHAVYWALNSSGLLTLSDNAGMAEYKCSYDSDWLAYKDSIESVQINPGVTSIDNAAFEGCGDLKDVTIPETVTSIGESAFSDCSSLTGIEIPSGVTNIENYTFAGCSSLSDVTIPSDVTSIGDAAFSGCSALASVTVLPSARSVRKAAPEKNGTSAAVTIPATVTSIGDYAFSGCDSLREIRFLGTPPSIGQNSFSGVTATAYYFSDHGWTDVDLQSYGGWLIWVKIILYYEITVADCKNGTVTASVDGKAAVTAASGTTVTLNVSPDPGYELDSLTVTDAAGFEIPVTDSRFIMPAGGVTVTAVFREPLYVTAQSYSIALTGKIGLSFYVVIPEELIAAGIRPEVFSEGLDVEVEAFGPTTREGMPENTYEVQTSVYAKHDQRQVTLRFYLGNELVPMYKGNQERMEGDAYVHSVYDYLMAIKDMGGKLGDLGRAMRNYCESVRKYFNIDPAIAYDITEIQPDKDAVAPYKIGIPQNLPDGLSYYAIALAVQSDTKLQIYFQVSGGHDISEYTFMIDGSEAIPVKQGNFCYIESRPISAKDLDTVKDIRVNGAAFSNVSALSYATNVINSTTTDASLKQVAMTIYEYNQAANRYFG